jgi:hypothetical protein
VLSFEDFLQDFALLEGHLGHVVHVGLMLFEFFADCFLAIFLHLF